MTTTANQGDSGEGGKNEREPVDLSELKGLSFGPAWQDSGSGSAKGERRQTSSVKAGGRTTAHRDRRPARPARSFPKSGDRPDREKSDGPSRPSRFSKAGGEGSRPPREQEHFRPTVEVSIYPDEEPFKALAQAMRTSCRTYELFDIARLILAKTERFVVVVRPWGGTSRERAVQMHLYLSLPDGMPFESEEEAVEHVITNHLENFFEIEEAEVDPPSGNFPMVNRCTVTGELLGPPNYHRYQEFVQTHFSQRIHNMSFERFQQKIETVRDEAAVAEWLEKMRKVTRYRAREAEAGQDPAVFDSLEGARRFLITHKKGQLLKEVENVRLEGKMIAQLPAGNIRRSIEVCLEQQRRFPLDTANHLRGRFRRLKFNLYKKGSHGVSFVCAVKRKFRDPDLPLADGAARLIQFIEANPDILAAKLPEQYLGLKPEPTPEISEASEEANPEAPKQMRYADQPELRRLHQDLRWLITEGYVTEFADGRLFAPAPLEPKKSGSAQAKKETKTVQPAAQGASDTAETAPDRVAEPTPNVSKPVESTAEPASDVDAVPTRDTVSPVEDAGAPPPEVDSTTAPTPDHTVEAVPDPESDKDADEISGTDESGSGPQRS